MINRISPVEFRLGGFYSWDLLLQKTLYSSALRLKLLLMLIVSYALHKLRVAIFLRKISYLEVYTLLHIYVFPLWKKQTRYLRSFPPRFLKKTHINSSIKLSAGSFLNKVKKMKKKMPHYCFRGKMVKLGRPVNKARVIRKRFRKSYLRKYYFKAGRFFTRMVSGLSKIERNKVASALNLRRHFKAYKNERRRKWYFKFNVNWVRKNILKHYLKYRRLYRLFNRRLERRLLKKVRPNSALRRSWRRYCFRKILKFIFIRKNSRFGNKGYNYGRFNPRKGYKSKMLGSQPRLYFGSLKGAKREVKRVDANYRKEKKYEDSGRNNKRLASNINLQYSKSVKKIAGNVGHDSAVSSNYQNKKGSSGYNNNGLAKNNRRGGNYSNKWSANNTYYHGHLARSKSFTKDANYKERKYENRRDSGRNSDYQNKKNSSTYHNKGGSKKSVYPGSAYLPHHYNPKLAKSGKHANHSRRAPRRGWKANLRAYRLKTKRANRRNLKFATQRILFRKFRRRRTRKKFLKSALTVLKVKRLLSRRKKLQRRRLKKFLRRKSRRGLVIKKSNKKQQLVRGRENAKKLKRPEKSKKQIKLQSRRKRKLRGRLMLLRKKRSKRNLLSKKFAALTLVPVKQKKVLFLRYAFIKFLQLISGNLTLSVSIISLYKQVFFLKFYRKELRVIFKRCKFLLRRPLWGFDFLFLINYYLTFFKSSFFFMYVIMFLQKRRRQAGFIKKLVFLLKLVSLFKRAIKGIRILICGKYNRHSRRRKLVCQFGSNLFSARTLTFPLIYNFFKCDTKYGTFSFKIWIVTQKPRLQQHHS